MDRDMPLDGVRCFVVLRDSDPVKFNDAAQFIDKDIEQFSRFAVGAYSLGDTDKRLVARHYGLLGRRETQLNRFAHERLDATNWKLGSFDTRESSADSFLRCARRPWRIRSARTPVKRLSV